jgi:DNA-binding MarR family transcriptional regulator
MAGTMAGTMTDPNPTRPSAPAAPAPSRPRTDLLVGLEQEIGVMMRRVKHVIGARARLVHPELQGSSYLMLSWLAAAGPQRASAMADRFGIDKGAISRQVQHLLDLGLADREPDPDDGRATLVSASADAVAKLEAVTADRRRWLDGRLAGWSEDDLAGFVELLRRYNEALEALESRD